MERGSETMKNKNKKKKSVGSDEVRTAKVEEGGEEEAEEEEEEEKKDVRACRSRSVPASLAASLLTLSVSLARIKALKKKKKKKEDEDEEDEDEEDKSEVSFSRRGKGIFLFIKTQRLLLGAVLPPTAPPASVTMSIATDVRGLQKRKGIRCEGSSTDAGNRSLPKPLLLVTAREVIRRTGATRREGKRRQEKQGWKNKKMRKGEVEMKEEEEKEEKKEEEKKLCKLSSNAAKPRTLIIRWEWHEDFQLAIEFGS
ncbi:hypothetical protein M0802_010362 [Mischocyttarus mexicanus]|nr:hypothetical protein M0802_010362 [Mischocyttarus mexicanus]